MIRIDNDGELVNVEGKIAYITRSRHEDIAVSDNVVDSLVNLGVKKIVAINKGGEYGFVVDMDAFVLHAEKHRGGVMTYPCYMTRPAVMKQLSLFDLKQYEIGATP